MVTRLSDTANPWVIRLPCESSESLGKLRLLPAIQVLVEDNAIWLRGDVLGDRLENQLRSLPDAERFRIGDDDQLTLWEETVPRGRLPIGRWQSLADWLPIEFPTAAFAGGGVDRMGLLLVRSEEVVQANVLQTDWTVWRDYAVTAPQFRLNQWSFAVSGEGVVIIRGWPLPPIPGKSFVEQSCIAIPAGWRLEPRIESELIRKLLQLPANSLAIFDSRGEVEVLDESMFVRATRSAVRMTDQSLSTLGAPE